MAIETASLLRTRVDPLVDSPVSAAPTVQRSSGGTRRRRGRTLTRAARQTVGPHLVSEDLFEGVLIRERKRSDRSNQPFILLLMTADGLEGERASLAWAAAAAAVTAAKRDTDVAGWLKRRSELGVILPDIGGQRTVVTELELRVRHEISRRLDQATAATFSLRFYSHAPAGPGGGPDVESIDPFLSAIGDPRSRTSYDVLKRWLDVAGSLALLIVLAPLLSLLAVLVKLGSPGPIFFRQTRIGLNARPFTMPKFRTMRVNSDHAVHQKYVSWFIKSSDQTPDAGKTTLFKIADDPRVTTVGRILRKTSFDELPQLWSVLRGDMSLVGPRPPLHYEVEQYKQWHRRRVLEAKPGITGLWQVSGRSRTTFDEMVRLDLRYARTRSLWTDINILLATPAAVISGKGAC